MTVHDIDLQTLSGDAATLGDFAGSTILVVNVASQCGLTPQYAVRGGLRGSSRTTSPGGWLPLHQFGAQAGIRGISGFCSVN